MADVRPLLVEHRKRDNALAIVFVHGFLGRPEETWGKFPDLLVGEGKLDGWDIYSAGYPSDVWFDFVGIWKADPPIDILARSLETTLGQGSLRHHQGFTLIAHSMGGLVVQKALTRDAELAERVDNVFLFGTPSNGLVKARFSQRWKRQVRDMASGGEFITGLRRDWDQTFVPRFEAQQRGEGKPIFRFWTIAGSQDEFVPSESSLGPFLESQRGVVDGDHLSIVKPTSADHQSVQLVVGALVAEAAATGLPISPAELTVQTRRFRQTIDQLTDTEALDPGGLVRLALALVQRQAKVPTWRQ